MRRVQVDAERGIMAVCRFPTGWVRPVLWAYIKKVLVHCSARVYGAQRILTNT